MATATARPQKPKILNEEETPSTLEGWINSVEYFLLSDPAFTEFTEGQGEWEKTSGTSEHRGLTSDTTGDASKRLTAAQKHVNLKRMLGHRKILSLGYGSNVVRQGFGFTLCKQS